MVVLYNVRSLYNVGSIFRTADAASVSKIYLCGITSKPKDDFGFYKKRLSKVALGAEKYVDWEYAYFTKKVIQKLKKEGFKIIAVERSKRAKPYFKFSLKKLKIKKAALILGNEIKGLDSKILKLADYVLEIPMLGKKESLNVSVAFGIIVFSLRYGA